MTRLEEVNGLVKQKREKMGALLQKRKERASKAFTPEELTEFTALNAELEPLTKEQETLQAVETAAAQTEAYLAKELPVGGSLPGTARVELGEIKLKDDRGNYLPESEIASQIDALAKAKVAEYKGKGLAGGALTGLDPISQSAELADAFVKSVAFTKYNKSAHKSDPIDIETKALLDTTAFPIANVRSDRVVELPLRRLVVANLLPNGQITGNRFLYVEETTATNNAAAVAEAGTKPESALAFQEVSADVRKIATVLPVTDELFEDAPAMRSYVQGRLIVFLQIAEENQILNGNGVAPNLLGILNNPLIQHYVKTADDTYADAVYRACTKIQVVSQLTASGVVMHPNDWQTIRLDKDAVGQYLFGSPLAGDIERIFGYPVVKSTGIAEGLALPGAWDLAAMLLRRTGITFAVATEHADFFIKNQLMLRVEERVALPVFRPQGFCDVDFIP